MAEPTAFPGRRPAESAQRRHAGPDHTVPIGHIGEFIDVLSGLLDGHRLECLGAGANLWRQAGARVYWAHETLQAHGLIEPVQAPCSGGSHRRVYGLSLRGVLFARRAVTQWRRQPLWRRLWARALH
jgi:hypothetical protein